MEKHDYFVVIIIQLFCWLIIYTTDTCIYYLPFPETTDIFLGMIPSLLAWPSKLH